MELKGKNLKVLILIIVNYWVFLIINSVWVEEFFCWFIYSELKFIVCSGVVVGKLKLRIWFLGYVCIL